MNELMSYAEMKTAFDGEWVLIGDPQTTRTLEITGGKILWHSKDRDEVYRKAVELKPKHSAVLYLGKLPEGMEYAL
jgi:hypothetical protein